MEYFSFYHPERGLLGSLFRLHANTPAESGRDWSHHCPSSLCKRLRCARTLKHRENGSAGAGAVGSREAPPPARRDVRTGR